VPMATLRCSVPYRRLLPAGFLAFFAVFAPWNDAAAATGRAVFNIVDYGARNDASAPATGAFKRAIAALQRAVAAQSTSRRENTPPGRSRSLAT